MNKVDKCLARQRKRERTQINKIINEKRDTTTNAIEIQMIIREYHEKSYSNKLDSPEEVDKFLETVC